MLPTGISYREDILPFQNDHSYAKLPKDPIKLPAKRKRVVTVSVLSSTTNISFKDICDSLLSESSCKQKDKGKDLLRIPAKPKKRMKKVLPGSSVTILTNNSEPVAQATVMEGTLLHGTEIPSEYVKIIVNSVCNTKVPLQIVGPFDEEDDVLTPGLITAWKIVYLS